MTARLWVFSALDTWFFRDGAPFHAGEGSQSNVKSMFPPFMTTLQGAIRTVLAEAQGWRPEAPEKWPPELGAADGLGNLKLRGPYLMSDDVYLFTPPQSLLGDEGGAAFTLLRPGQAVECDLGSACLPAPSQSLEGAKPLADKWLTRKGMEAVLKRQVPEPGEVRSSSECWRLEPRVGIERSAQTRTVKEGQLYSGIHVRPWRTTRLGVLVDGVPEAWHPAEPVAVRLGGEGRLASVEVRHADPASLLPAMPAMEEGSDGKLRFTVTLVTPGCYQDTALAVRQGPPGVPGNCVSACIGKLQQGGGWDLLRTRPRPLRPLLPAGSTWFYETVATERERIRSLHGACLGMDAEYGFGQVIIGLWGDEA